MTIISEITINTTQGPRVYQILREDPAIETLYEVVLIQPEPQDIASAESFDQAMNAITENLFYNEIDL